MIDHKTALEMFDYNVDTGIITRRKPAPRCEAGSVVGTKNNKGYLICRANYTIVYVHRLAWLLMTGEWPDKFIDHANGIRDDNRWENLRCASRAENGRNRGIARNNTSGVPGVHWFKQYGCWRAMITVGGEQVFLGYFKDKAEAIRTRLEAERQYFGEFARAA